MLRTGVRAGGDCWCKESAFRIPDACVARGWRFEVELTTPKQRSAVAQHFGARRFAYNWALAQVKGNLDARTADTTVPVLAWNLPAIRREWNQVKHRSPRGGGNARKRRTPAGSPIWSRLCTTGTRPSMAAAVAGGLAFLASRPATMTTDESVSLPVRCVWSPTGATSCCR